MSDIVHTLRSYRFNFTSEAQLQDGIEAALAAAGLAFEREVRLSAADRPDFRVGGVLIEVKVKGSMIEALRQCQRYAAHADTRSIILIGSCRWLTGLPSSIGGKPLTGIRLSRFL